MNHGMKQRLLLTGEYAQILVTLSPRVPAGPHDLKGRLHEARLVELPKLRCSASY